MGEQASRLGQELGLSGFYRKRREGNGIVLNPYPKKGRGHLPSSPGQRRPACYGT